MRSTHWNFKWNGYTFKRDNSKCQNWFASLSRKGLRWKERIGSPREPIHSFQSRPLFTRGLVCKKANRKSQKCVKTSVEYKPAHDKTYNKTCVTSKDFDQPVLLLSTAGVIVHPSSDSPKAAESTGDHRRLWSDVADAQADLSLRWSHKSFVGFVVRWFICKGMDDEPDHLRMKSVSLCLFYYVLTIRFILVGTVS